MQPAKQTYRGKACAECRQQKLRCDAKQDCTKPCSRCQKTGIECSIPDSFHRTKRQSKAAMQREIDKLQKQRKVMESRETDNNEASLPPGLEQPTSLNLSLPSAAPFPQAPDLESFENSCLDPPGIKIFHQPSNTARSLDGLELEARKIDDCFGLFFEHYYSYVPVVEQGHTPSQYYQNSPLLFWTIVAIGSRRYIDDPTILPSLAPRVSTLALQSLAEMSQHIQTIQSLMLLCTWPFPADSIHNDPSLVYAGAAMQLALQNGLHMFSKRQDFARSRLGHTEFQEIFTARLWACCKIVCHGTSFCSGLQPYVIADAFDLEQQRQDLIPLLPRSVYWTQKLHKVLSTALSALMNSILVVDQETAATAIGHLIDIFDDQMLETSRQAASELSTLRTLYSRLHVRAFHFFEAQASGARQYTKLIELHHIACSFIETISAADATDDFALYTTEMIYQTLTLAACSILRIYRSELRLRTDLSGGERHFFNAIHILRKRSLQNNDLSSRTAVILTQLWQSKQAFRRVDGTFNPLHIRIRSRGSMGVVYDCFWYWRHEFNGQADPYSEQNNKGHSDLPVVSNVPDSNVPDSNAPDSNAPATHIPWSMENLGGENQGVTIPSIDDRMFPEDPNEFDIFDMFPSWEWPGDYDFAL